ncbi:hypothetical protein C8R47DRAFT_1082823 [Mycena vitilis]|nr:hypothetical protein C8R47DRAFT_1082823 [Mycena vitilis]
MLAFWSSPYQPVAQDEKLSESDSTSDLQELHNEGQTRRDTWLGRFVLGIAAANVLIALTALVVTRDISKLHIPIGRVDVASLPKPNPYVGLNMCMSSILRQNACLPYIKNCLFSASWRDAYVPRGVNKKSDEK